jgi:tripartite-type tricarboxylate transporter receptor subunit TctC
MLPAGEESPRAAEPYPVRTIKLIVPWPPGSIVDLQARRIGEQLGRALRQPVVIDNRPGASGTIGLALAAKAAPDGYTFTMGSTSNLAASPAMGAPLGYHPVKSFDPITLFAWTPFVLVANPSLGARDVRQLVALAKAKPGSIAYASSGPTSTAHVLGMLLEREGDAQLLHVPYKGSGQALLAVLSNEVALAFDFADTCAPQVNAGKLLALLVTGPRRVPLLPEVPTAAEAGVPGVELLAWGGFLAPKGTPREVIDRLNREIVQIVQAPAMRSELTKAGWEVVASSPEEFGQVIEAEQAKWARVVKLTGVKAEQ